MAVNPKIDIFEAKRAKKVTDSTTGETQVIADEEGTSLLFSIKTSFGNDTGEGYTDYLDFGFYITVYESDRWSGWTRVGSKDILPNNPILTDLRNGVTDSFIIGDIPSIIGQTEIVEINGSKSYQIAADLTNGSEHSYFNVSVPFSFVNMHLSASSSGGIAFGKYLENAGYFECKYPTRIYDNLTVDGNQENYGSLYVKNNLTDVAIFEGNGIRIKDAVPDPRFSSSTHITPSGIVADSVGVGPNGLQVGNASIGSSTTVYGPITATGKITSNSLRCATIDNITGGEQLYPSVPAGDSFSDTIRFYGMTYNGPKVVVCLEGTALGQCNVWVTSVNPQGFTLTVKNNDTVARNIGISWIAIGGL